MDQVLYVLAIMGCGDDSRAVPAGARRAGALHLDPGMPGAMPAALQRNTDRGLIR
jgi:hypothetical protein